MGKIKTKLLTLFPGFAKSFLGGFFIMVGLIGGYSIVKGSYHYSYDGGTVTGGATLTADMWNWALTHATTFHIGDGQTQEDLFFDDLWTLEKSAGRHHIQAGPHDGPLGSPEYPNPGRLYLNPWNGAGDVWVGGGDSSNHNLYVANGNFITNNGENGIEILKNEKRVVLGSTNSNSNIEIYGNGGVDGHGTDHSNSIVYDASSGHVFRGGEGSNTKVYINGELCLNNVCTSTLGGGSSLWQQSGNRLYTTADGVGIGNSNPTEKLDVTGNIKASGSVCAGTFCIGNGTVILRKTTFHNNSSNVADKITEWNSFVDQAVAKIPSLGNSITHWKEGCSIHAGDSIPYQMKGQSIGDQATTMNRCGTWMCAAIVNNGGADVIVNGTHCGDGNPSCDKASFSITCMY